MASLAQTAPAELAIEPAPAARSLAAWVQAHRGGYTAPAARPTRHALLAPTAAAHDAPLASIVQSILNSMQVGAMAVDAGLHVAFANRAAVHECRRLGLTQTDAHTEDPCAATLAWAAGADRQRLAQAVATAHTGQWSMVRLGGGAQPLTVAVFPLGHGEPGAAALALLVFGLSLRHEPLAVQLYARSCDLTPAETRVLLGLSEGLVPKQIASRHGVLLSTVRTQISAIRGKTGTRGLADLIQVLTMLPPIMPTLTGRA